MNTAAEILTALRSGSISMNGDEINVAWGLLKERHNRLQRKKVNSFMPGDRVSWVSSRNGLTVMGRVRKTNQKTVSVMADTGVEWRVGAELLKKLEVAVNPPVLRHKDAPPLMGDNGVSFPAGAGSF